MDRETSGAEGDRESLRRENAALKSELERSRVREIEVRGKKALCSDVLASTRDWYWEVDEYFAFRYCSDGMKEIIGYEPEEIIGRTPFEFIMPIDQPRMEQTKADVFRSRQPFRDLECWVYTREGQELCALVSGIPFFSEDGVFGGFRGICRDITERKQMEILVHSVRDIALALGSVRDLNEGLTLCLRTALSLSGMDAGGVYLVDQSDGSLHLAVSEGLPPEYISRVSFYTADSPNTRLLMNGQPMYTHASDIRESVADGSFPEGIRLVAAIPILHQGNVIGGFNFASFTLDEFPALLPGIVEAVVAPIGNVIARLQTEQALRESEEKFSRAFASGPVPISISRVSDGKFLEVNDAVVSDLGYSREEMVGKTAQDLGMWEDPKERDAFVNLLETQGFLREYEVHTRTRNGMVRDSLFSAEIIEIGGEKCVLSVNYDITERKRNERLQAINFSRMEALLHLNQMANASINEMADYALEESVRLTSSDIGYIAFLDDAEEALTIYSWSKHAMEQCGCVDQPIQYLVKETGLWGEAVRQRRAIITNDYDAPNPWKKGYPEGHVPVKSHMNVPIFSGSRIVAVVGVGNKSEPYDDTDVMQLTLIMEGLWRLFERKRAEEALKESESTIRGILDATPVGIVFVKDRVFLSANDAACDMLGYTLEELLNLDAREFYFSERQYRDIGELMYSPLLKQGKMSVETRMKKQDGAPVDVLMTGGMLHAGNPSDGFVVTLHDISAHKRAEEERERTLSILQATLESTEDGILVVRKSNEIAVYNRKFLDMWGLTEEEIAGMDAMGMIDYAMSRIGSQDEFRTRIMRYYEQPDKEGFGVVELHDGRVFECYSRPQRIGDDVVGRVWDFRDVTLRMKNEDALLESEKKYRTLIENSPDLIMRFDREARHLFVNRNVEDVVGIDPEAFIGKTHKELGFPESFCEVWEQYIARVFEKKEAVQEQISCTIQGKETSFDWRLTPEFGRDGEVATVLAFGVSITEQKKAELDLREKTETLNAIFEIAPYVMMLVDGDCRVIDVNREGKSFAGKEEEHILGTLCGEVIGCINILGDTMCGNGMECPECPIRGSVTHTLQTGEAIRNREARIVVQRETCNNPLNLLISTSPLKTKEGDRVLVTLVDITERKQAELTLKETAEKLAATINSIPDLLFEVDSEGIIYDYHSPSHELLYVPPEMFLNRNLRDVLPADASECILSGLERASREGWDRGAMYALDLPDGRRWFELSIEEKGDADRFIALARDVTSRVQSDEALKQSEEKFNKAFHSTPISLSISTLDEGRFLEINEEDDLFLGFPSGEVIGKTSLELGIWVDPEDRKDVVHSLKSGKPVRDREYRLRVKSGKIAITRYSAVLIDIGGEPCILSAFLDITEQKQAESQLIENERKYRLLFDASPVGIGLARPNGVVLDTNRSLQEIFGYSPEEFKKINTLDLYRSPIQRDELTKQLVRGKKVRGLEVEMLRSDGRGRWVLMNVDILYGDEGPLYLTTVRDITESKMMEQQFFQAQKMETIGRLAGGVAHDFNNILTVINANAELALMFMEPTDQHYEAFEEIKKSGERAANLTRQLLAFSRKQITEPRVINLNKTLLDMDKMLRRLIGENIELKTIPEDSLSPIKADPGQIEQVIINLVVNARDAMPNGGKLTLETKNVFLDEEYAKTHAETISAWHVMLAVSDTGIGMDEDVLSHIFEPFFTTKPVGKGTGLGLSTCYGIVKQNRGGIWIYSEPDRGTTIKVYLPAIEDMPQPFSDDGGHSIFAGGTETVLVVEDDTDIRKLVIRHLIASGYTVMSATNGDEALALVQKLANPIDLLITDMVMPLMGGRELADRLAVMRPGIHILFMSGYTDNAIVHQDVLNREVKFIQKPFSMAEFMKKIREAIED